MRKNQKGSNKAKEILQQIGFDEVTELSMKDLLAGFDVIYIEEELNGSDGVIIRGKSKTIIKVDTNISTLQRKRFVAAHELGHFFLHDKLEFHLDDEKTLSWNRLEEVHKRGIQEIEANDFAGELLMPLFSLFLWPTVLYAIGAKRKILNVIQTILLKFSHQSFQLQKSI